MSFNLAEIAKVTYNLEQIKYNLVKITTLLLLCEILISVYFDWHYAF